jgi:hypothetical protein
VIRFFSVLIIILNLPFSLSFAAGIFSTVSSRAGEVNTEIYNVLVEKKIKLEDTNEQKIDYELKQELTVLKTIIAIAYNINFYFKAGFVNSEIQINNNKYSGQSDVSMYGGGIKYIFFPDTIITPAVIFDLGVTSSFNRLNTLKINNFKEKINTTLDILEYHSALIISKRFNFFEPFGGVNFSINQIKWENEDTQEQFKGTGNNKLVPFIGSKVLFYPLLSLIIEMDFIDGMSVGAGLNFKF